MLFISNTKLIISYICINAFMGCNDSLVEKLDESSFPAPVAPVGGRTSPIGDNGNPNNLEPAGHPRKAPEAPPGSQKKRPGALFLQRGHAAHIQ